MATFHEKLDFLKAYPAAARDLVMSAEGEGQLVDAVGTLHRNRQLVYEQIRLAVKELDPGTSGSEFTLEQANQADRSYNHSSLLIKLMASTESETLSGLLRFLMATGVLKLTWSYSKLMQLIRSEGIDLAIAQHEITDGDPDFDIGEVWKKGSPSFKPLVGDEGGA